MANASVDVEGVDALLRRLDGYPRAVVRAARRAVDRTATQVRRLVVDGIVAETTVKRPAVNKNVKVTQRSRLDKIEAKVAISRTPILVRDFKPKTRRRATTVAADISTKPGVGVVIVKKAFKPSGKPKRDIYERVRRGGERVSRYPIKLATGPSAATMAGPILPEVIDKGEDYLEQQFLQELGKEVRRADARQ